MSSSDSEVERLAKSRAGRLTSAIAIASATSIFVPTAVACIWRPNAIAALTLIPAWCFLLVGALPTIVTWRMGFRRIAAVFAIHWLMFGIGWVEELRSLARLTLPKSRGTRARDVQPLRIISLNCAGNPKCVADLMQVDPDVVLLQEAPADEQLVIIARELFGDAAGLLAGGDTAILTRGRIDGQFIDRAGHFVVGVVKLNDGRRVKCVSLRLDPPISRLDFWNRGFWSDHRELRDRHRNQLRQVLMAVGKELSTAPAVIGGDFNTVPLDRALDQLRPQLSDAFTSVGRGWGATGTNDWPLFRVDQIWTNSKMAPSFVESKKTISSDHRMVICEMVNNE
jgi:hypothetical protein